MKNDRILSNCRVREHLLRLQPLFATHRSGASIFNIVIVLVSKKMFTFAANKLQTINNKLSNFKPKQLYL